MAALMLLLVSSGTALAQESSTGLNPVEGMEVQLKDASGKVVRTTTTNADGSFTFDDLAEGEYTFDISSKQVSKSRSNIQNNRVALMKAKEKANRTKSGVSVASGDVDGDGVQFTLNFTKITYKTSPRDAASGQATGKRTHKPVRFVKEWNPSTPILFNVAKGGGSVGGHMGWDLATAKGG